MGALTILALVILAIVLVLSDDKPAKQESQLKPLAPEKHEEETSELILPEEKFYTDCEDGAIRFYTLNTKYGWSLPEAIYVEKENIIELSSREIKCYRIFDEQNHDYASLIKHKEDLKTWQEKWEYTYRYEDNYYLYGWREITRFKVEEFNYQVTPIQEVFTDKLGGKYKLIESVDELNAYLLSNLFCNDWCRLKLISTMKSLNLGDGFITGFADLIGNDLEKYHLMIDLAKEVKDIDTLMYMFVYKFGKKEETECRNLNITNSYYRRTTNF